MCILQLQVEGIRRARLGAYASRCLARRMQNTLCVCLKSWRRDLYGHRMVEQMNSRRRGWIAVVAVWGWARQAARRNAVECMHRQQQQEVQLLCAAAENSRQAREWTENELFHTQEALSKALSQARLSEAVRESERDLASTHWRLGDQSHEREAVPSPTVHSSPPPPPTVPFAK